MKARLLFFTFLFFLAPATPPVQAQPGCEAYPQHLENCQPFSCSYAHPFTGETMKKEIIGIEEGVCITTEQMPGDGSMDCRLSQEEQKSIAAFLTKAFNAETSSVHASDDEHVYKIDGDVVENPLDKAMNDGSCHISGYD